jgi:hypothetical protein
MTRTEQSAKEIPNTGPGREGSSFDHPAFGQISASRVSATPGRTLYGSDFVHRAWVTLRISRSSFDRSLSRDWHHELGQLIEIDLSEAQWATFVSSLNLGSGVPCTLNQVGHEQMPGITRRVETEHFLDETREVVASAIRQVEEARTEVDASGLPASKRRSISETLRQVAQHLRSNLPFVTKSFDEHVEKKVEKAKVEINAYMTTRIMSAGLGGPSPLHLEIEGPKK